MGMGRDGIVSKTEDKRDFDKWDWHLCLENAWILDVAGRRK
jgi:hypothetical protein